MITLMAFLADAVSNTGNSVYGFYVIGMQILLVVLFIGFMLFFSGVTGPKRKTKEKLENFTSGIKSHGSARHPIAVKYFLVAILFVLFDVEVIFFYPYAVDFRSLGWSGLGDVLIYLAFFLVGYIYILKKGALKWEN